MEKLNEKVEDLKEKSQELKDINKILHGEDYVPLRKFFYECKTEVEKHKLRDHYLETVYNQIIIQNTTLSNIQEQLKDIRKHMDYLDLDREERKYANEDGSAKYNAIVYLCGRIERELLNGRTEM